jgi:ShK domain-like
VSSQLTQPRLRPRRRGRRRHLSSMSSLSSSSLSVLALLLLSSASLLLSNCGTIVAGVEGSSVAAGGGGGAAEWYQECEGNSCGYGGGSGRRRSSAGSNCQDSNPNCREYARRGECYANSNWMSLNCRFSCGKCEDDGDDGEDGECVDLHSNCPRWADQLECFTNPGYTHRACRKSCWLCVDTKELRRQSSADDEGGGSDNVTEADIRHRIRFSQTDWGEWQAWNNQNDATTVGGGPTPTEVKERIIRMGQYQHSLKSIGRGTVCNNLKHHCAKWATKTQNPDGSTKDDCRDNLLFMIGSCSLACEYCSVVQQYHTCRPLLKEAHQPKNHVFFGRQDRESGLKSIYQHLMSAEDIVAVDLLKSRDDHKKSSISKTTTTCDSDLMDDGGDNSYSDEWIVSFNRTSLWKNNKDGHENESLLEYLKSIPDSLWVDATSLSSDLYDTTSHHNAAVIMAVTPSRSGRVLRLSSLSSIVDTDVVVVDKFRSTVSTLLQVPETHLEMEFVHYERGERYRSHSDLRLHDVWKQSGARLLSMYVALSNPTTGGNVGFPDLDWLLIDEPQVLIWPNVVETTVDGDDGSGGSTVAPLLQMKTEQLPVVEGELYGVHIWLHEYKYDESSFCA